MKFRELEHKFDSLSEKILALIAEACHPVFGQKFDIQVGEKSPVKETLPDSDPPYVHLEFTVTAEDIYLYHLNIGSDLGIKLMSWMLQMEPEETLSHETCEGLEEAANQVLGQVQTALDADGISITLGNLKSQLVAEAPEKPLEAPAGEGLRISYALTTGDEAFTLDQHIWFVGAANEHPADDEPVSEIEDFDPDSLFQDEPDETEEDEPVSIHPAGFEPMTPSNGSGQPRNISMLMDVDLNIKVELGKKTMQVKDILKLGKGTVIELDKAAGEPLDLFVSGRKFAEGEVVVVDDHFGIRITQLLGTKKRIESLG